MGPDLVITVLKESIGTAGLVMMPILLTGMVTGVTVAVVQAATQVNEPTLTFVPKSITVGIVGALILPWALDRLVGVVHMVMARIGDVVVH